MGSNEGQDVAPRSRADVPALPACEASPQAAFQLRAIEISADKNEPAVGTIGAPRIGRPQFKQAMNALQHPPPGIVLGCQNALEAENLVAATLQQILQMILKPRLVEGLIERERDRIERRIDLGNRSHALAKVA